MKRMQLPTKRKFYSKCTANGRTVTFVRPQHMRGFSLLQSGRIKRVSATTRGMRRNGQRLTSDHACAQFYREEMPTAHVVAVAVAPGRRRRHRNEIDETRHASDNQTSIIQCDRGRASVGHHDRSAAVCPCSSVAPRRCPISSIGLGAAQERH